MYRAGTYTEVPQLPSRLGYEAAGVEGNRTTPSIAA
jgi:hypothetical protein